MSFYNLTILAPKKVQIHLSARRKNLSLKKSWSLQGQPFYSGGVDYFFSVNVEADGEYRLDFSKIRDVAELTVNGKYTGKTVKPPYSFKARLSSGENHIKLTVYNSFANAMEGYSEESGVLCGGTVSKIL